MKYLTKFELVLIALLSIAGIVSAIGIWSIWPVLDAVCFIILYVMLAHSEGENRELKETIRTLRASIREELK